ncbi:MAG: hypothetical protein DYG93_06600 [Leptolyngbya sp. PLA2]|nr:hypothetical protein [Leptolyngbya sp.]MCE7971319.1 hypothetical protein [Leptolyngbya sp. PL-A2]MCQ3940536.1 hypothetical protein [cyanobacterium CYA1]MCZ7632468.1 hypothetical protein [Phycisphaerales bacterium]MDL1903506.1 hypothetical protein [Synechococcales cyanobacterium CNB]GIK19977.1 MAG: hypothetical protein BroJett004_21410 [Planctomycetota bacterium]
MKSKAGTVKEYLTSLPDDRRRKIEVIGRTTRQATANRFIERNEEALRGTPAHKPGTKPARKAGTGATRKTAGGRGSASARR